MPSKDSSLDSWLEYISGVHPREIDLGLDRIARVAGRLLTARPAKQIITVAGTNGKGSNVAAMEAVLLANNYSVAHAHTAGPLLPPLPFFNPPPTLWVAWACPKTNDCIIFIKISGTGVELWPCPVFVRKVAKRVHKAAGP